MIRKIWQWYVDAHKRLLGIFGLKPVTFRQAWDDVKADAANRRLPPKRSAPPVTTDEANFTDAIAQESERRRKAKQRKKQSARAVIAAPPLSEDVRMWKEKESMREASRHAGREQKSTALPDEWEEIDDYVDDDGVPYLVADATGRPKAKSGAIAEFKYLNAKGVDRDMCLTDWKISGPYIDGIGEHGDEITCRLDRILKWNFHV